MALLCLQKYPINPDNGPSINTRDLSISGLPFKAEKQTQEMTMARTRFPSHYERPQYTNQNATTQGYQLLFISSNSYQRKIESGIACLRIIQMDPYQASLYE